MFLFIIVRAKFSLVVERPGRVGFRHGGGGAWAAFRSGAVEAHPTLEYQVTKHVEAPGQPSVVELWRPTLP